MSMLWSVPVTGLTRTRRLSSANEKSPQGKAPDNSMPVAWLNAAGKRAGITGAGDGDTSWSIGKEKMAPWRRCRLEQVLHVGPSRTSSANRCGVGLASRSKTVAAQDLQTAAERTDSSGLMRQRSPP